MCNRELLEQRVASESRKRFRKIKDVEKLRAVLDRHELFAPIPFVSSLSIDTADTSPGEAARRIVEHYGLNTSDKPSVSA